MQALKITSILLIMVLLGGCYYDVEEEIYGNIECTTEDMSYTDEILPILVADCYECHSAANNFGNVTLEGYDALEKYIEDNSLLGAVRHDVGFSPMPKGGAKLLDCEVEKIAAWINDGAPNN